MPNEATTSTSYKNDGHTMGVQWESTQPSSAANMERKRTRYHVDVPIRANEAAGNNSETDEQCFLSVVTSAQLITLALCPNPLAVLGFQSIHPLAMSFKLFRLVLFYGFLLVPL